MVHCSKFVVLFQKFSSFIIGGKAFSHTDPSGDDSRGCCYRFRYDDTRQIHLLAVLERSFLLIEWYRTTLFQM
jgi:hypothetical protein